MTRLKKLVRKWLDLDEIEQNISAAHLHVTRVDKTLCEHEKYGHTKLEEQMRSEFRAETMEYLCQIQDLRDELNERIDLLAKLAEEDRAITDVEIKTLHIEVDNAIQK